MAIIRYADDFVVIHRERHCRKGKRSYLRLVGGNGLELKPSKTKIAHTIENLDGKAGFDFLDCRKGSIGTRRPD